MTERFDVVIIGGAMMGSSVAWWLSRHPDFNGSILVLERDPTFAQASTTHSNSCIRQQFGSEINIRISQFGAEFLKNWRDYLGSAAPKPAFREFGYLYLAADEPFADALRANHALQTDLGAGTVLLSPEEITARYPMIDPTGLLLGSLGTRDEGYFDGHGILAIWREQAKAAGVTRRTAEVTGLRRTGAHITTVCLADGSTITAGAVVNCSGPSAAYTAQMAGLDLPVAPQKAYSFLFDVAEPLPLDLPLTITPNGVHVRPESRSSYLAGCMDAAGPGADYDDFQMDHALWMDLVWPTLAERIPVFERIKLRTDWVGHYAINTLDHNAIVGAHPEAGNFYLCNGFSGHGLQQSPAMGRGLAELIATGRYQTLDLSPLGYERVAERTPLVERAVI
ncbi:NAD(P)/FAD-dependent oxidoreductase [Aestuariibius sp. 2305UL40-4]|uniref:NAD(P)/FAD-dependent oxidoreductase n=1 Tax=Aestuariibius violaceus TaxID=3234132 RepID=UPI00345EEFF3